MSIDNIKLQGSELQRLLANTSAKKQLWIYKKKEITKILQALLAIPSLVTLDLSVQDTSHPQSMDVLLVKFNNNLSWIKNKSVKPNVVLKDGPALIFEQNSLGQIIVRILYSFAEVPQEMQQNTLLGYYDPANIDEDVVYTVFSDFLSALITWNK